MGCGFTFNLLMMGFVTIPALAIFYRNFDLLSGIYTIPFHSFSTFEMDKLGKFSLTPLERLPLLAYIHLLSVISVLW